MEIDPVIFWNVVLTLIIAPAVWAAFRNMMAEIKRIDILLNRTREDYASRAEVKDEMQHVMEALHRLEDKLDRVLSRENR
jgi:membrane protein insertase Oxa1/YidC/SpoIIIJ